MKYYLPAHLSPPPPQEYVLALSCLLPTKALHKPFNRFRQLLRLAGPRAMTSVHILNGPFHAASLHEHVLHENGQRLVHCASHKREPALERGLLPCLCWGRGFKRERGMGKEGRG